MRYNKKSDRERRDSILKFRINRAEQKRLRQLKQETGLTLATIFRLRVLGTLTPMGDTEETRKVNAEVDAIVNRPDISGRRKRKLLRENLVKRVGAKLAEHEGKRRRKSA